jgi:hypothetical protein
LILGLATTRIFLPIVRLVILALKKAKCSGADIGQPVVLTPAANEDPIPTCVLCIQSSEPYEANEEERAFLKNLAGITRNELKNRWARQRQGKSADFESYIQELLKIVTDTKRDAPYIEADFAHAANQVRKHLVRFCYM